MASSEQSSTDLQRTLPADLTAGMVVFLVALPLCLGIALASNASPFSGLVAGIVGGVVVGALSGSHTSVSGPAAGLTAVVAAQITLLGSFPAFLTAVAVAGALQIVLGLIRAGSIAAFVPSSVIKGLLAAIGLILILKQLPHLVGHDADFIGDMSFLQPDERNTFSELAWTFFNLHPGAALVGLLSLLLLVTWDQVKWLQRVPLPAPLAVVLAGLGLGLVLEQVGGAWRIESTHLVQVPVAGSLREFLAFMQFPDVTALTHPRLITSAITIAAVASLETLLNVEAVDKLDPQRRVTPANRELVAQGVGNLTAGLLGGLPVTSVIVRSSVNLNAGSRTKLSAVFHGILLLLCVVLLPAWLNRIPLSCLAAVLIVTGFKLSKPKLFRQMWHEGLNQFLPFVVTIAAIVLTDLLVGILIGLGFAILFILRSNLRRPLIQVVEQHLGGRVVRVELANQVSFLNRAALSKAFDTVPRGGHLMIDARNTDYIDADVLDLIQEFLHEVAPARGVQVSMVGLRDHYEQLHDRVQYIDYTTRELQASLTPAKVLQILREGNERFRTGERLTRDLNRQREQTADHQHPLAIVLSGASSRTPVELIFDVGLGDMSCARVTGNLVSAGVLGSLEYACVVAGAKVIVVMGHSNSAVVRMAIEAALARNGHRELAQCQHLTRIVHEIQQSLSAIDLQGWDALDAEARRERIDDLYRAHLRRTIRLILEQSSALAALTRARQLLVVGAMYDVRSGAVEFFDTPAPVTAGT
ncbi:MAG: SulP family inorganic anion transporter [Pirellulaceae bacterium]|nr:SulP family inorganic anion transporter [Pirellulaceae bacterium]